MGGTFTDCCLMLDSGITVGGKALTTPGDLGRGVFAALETAAGEARVSVGDLLAASHQTVHGTTIATNAVVERAGARTGLITTRGHGDAIQIMRGGGRTTGLPPETMLRASRTAKPRPIVPRHLVREVTERVDWKGEVVVSLNRVEARRAIAELVNEGCEAIAVSFLWSFKNPTHEREVEALIREVQPDVYVSCGSVVAPLWGEYERTVAAVLNAYTGPVVTRYLDELDNEIKVMRRREGATRLFVMQASGGVASPGRAKRQPVRLFQSGPAGGVAASQRIGRELGYPNIITADVGGTTFDVALIVGHEAVAQRTMIVDQYEFFNQSIDIRSIGAGGGSKIRTDSDLGTIRVGPDSAGASPGPACYGRGGVEATLTDAVLVLGFLGAGARQGVLRLNRAKALEALAAEGKKIGLDPVALAQAAVAIAEHHMAELIHQITIGRGHDPRGFALFAYGGAGPIHAPALARELSISEVVVPGGALASVWSACGAGAANLSDVHELTDILSEPIEDSALTTRLREVRSRAVESMVAEGLDPSVLTVALSVDARYMAQVHVVEVPVEDVLEQEASAEKVFAAFDAKYEDLYGRGAGYSDAGRQIVTFRCRVWGRQSGGLTRPMTFRSDLTRGRGRPTTHRSREVFWPGEKRPLATAVFEGVSGLERDVAVAGPALIELGTSTVVVYPDQVAWKSGSGTFHVVSAKSDRLLAPGILVATGSRVQPS
ncbi:MAG: hydantoinase/oxoprolinase family protein [Candidatus Dormibacterales bacterium]